MLYSNICYDASKGLLMISNSSNADLIFKELLEKLLGDTATPWQWEGYEPYTVKKN